MCKNKIVEPIEATVLGKRTSFPQQYDPTVLVAVPRYENRKIYNIAYEPEIFVGVDAWHAYELGFITNNGLPVTGMLKLVYGAENQYLVESKSFKLYLNSFNMSHFGETVQEGIKIVLNKIQQDISNCLQTNVEVTFFSKEDEAEFDFNNYQLLEDDKLATAQTFDDFNENPDLLKATDCNELKVATHLLRSNCKITHQPDWGSAYIYIKGETVPSKASLLKYLVSFRNENHFHEEVCEMIYKRIWDLFSPEELMVTCLFTRRGGIDICPARASHKRLLPSNLINAGKRDFKLIRQ